MASKPHTLEYRGDPAALPKLWADTDDMLAYLYRRLAALSVTTASVASGVGPVGPMGPPGLAGADGEDGAQGVPGAKGVANLAIVMQRVVLGI